MNRMDRLFALVVLLKSRKRLRAEDLAAEFGVSRRTIYRDILALNQTGVPIVSLPGEGYELLEGNFLPPLAFNIAEASALVLGARLLRNQAAGSMVDAAGLATDKIAAVLPARIREEVEYVAEVIDFITPIARFDLDDPHLVTLQRALREQRVVHLRYHGQQRDELTERDVEPHA
jgi:predicted DNA-binding transcriptional regulator YafY